MKKTTLGGVKEKSGHDRTLKELFSFDCFTAHLLVIKQLICVQERLVASLMRKCWVYLLACQKQVRCLEVRRLQLTVGGLGDQAHKSRERSLPALGLGSAYSYLQPCNFISNNNAIDKWLCVSLLHWN